MAQPVEKRVEIFIAGVQKGGTTALCSYLCAHPAIAGGSRKEPHYFDQERFDWAAPNYRSYHKTFYVDAPLDKLWLDATPIYGFWPPSLARIKAYNPKARLIFSFRDPIERAHSHWRMERRRGAETLDFHSAVTTGRDRLARATPLSHEHRVYSYVERGLYGEQVRRILSLFPPEQVLFLSAHDLLNNPGQSLDAVWRFLGLAAIDVASIVAHDDPLDAEGQSEIAASAAYLRPAFRSDLRDFAALSGIDVTQWLTMQ